ncbi:MAG: hypothetical protein WC796_00870 [Candidatus Pacearchaeota archaeon]|jgi:hypothetical protein
MVKKAKVDEKKKKVGLLALWIVIGVIVVIIFGFGLVSITGNAVNKSAPVCKDSDYGFDYSKQGVVRSCSLGVFCSSSVDYCVDSKRLKEFVCNNNEKVVKTYDCPKYCQNGACVTKMTPVK